jgi:4-hydroxy-2-oxoglutarate aldolase
MALAREKQERIAQAAQCIVGELSIPAVKYAMDFNGLYGGPPRLPLTADKKAEVEQLLENIRN